MFGGVHAGYPEPSPGANTAWQTANRFGCPWGWVNNMIAEIQKTVDRMQNMQQGMAMAYGMGGLAPMGRMSPQMMKKQIPVKVLDLIQECKPKRETGLISTIVIV